MKIIFPTTGKCQGQEVGVGGLRNNGTKTTSLLKVQMFNKKKSVLIKRETHPISYFLMLSAQSFSRN